VTDPGYSLNLSTPPLQLPDFFASMSAMNKASLVLLLEEGIISADLAARIGRAVGEIIERENQPGARRSQDYLDFERDLLASAGADASWLHVSRSRQDMLSTGVSLWLRAAHLALFDDLLTKRRALLRLAQRHATAIIPTYTHGVQAQPASFAHYALAFLAALDRISTRLRESHARANARRGGLACRTRRKARAAIERKLLHPRRNKHSRVNPARHQLAIPRLAQQCAIAHDRSAT
jgi:argininosuccinate lyase